MSTNMSRIESDAISWQQKIAGDWGALYILVISAGKVCMLASQTLKGIKS